MMYRFGTIRGAHPAATMRHIEPLLVRAGITRLADVTGLDTLGVPVFQAVRPASRNISVSQGKGLTRLQARVSAAMEALEAFHAERTYAPVRHASVREMRRSIAYDPFALPLVPEALLRDGRIDTWFPPVGLPALLTDESVIEWIPATELSTGRESWVPRQLCTLDFLLRETFELPYFRATSNGLASGNSDEEAVVHALCEVVERDASCRFQNAWQDPELGVVQGTIVKGPARTLLERFASRGVSAHIVDITGPIRVPAYEVFLEQKHQPAHKGAGCHFDRQTALVRALTEAAQARLALIAGSRDDITRAAYPQSAFDDSPRALPRIPSPRRRFTDTRSLAVKTFAEAIDVIVKNIVDVTGFSPLRVDLRLAEFNLPVVFVIAPGLTLRAPGRT